MQNLKSNEKSAIAKFKTKAREFWGLWNELDRKKYSPVAQIPAFKNEYDNLMGRGLKIRKTVEGLTGVIDKAANIYTGVKGWIGDTFNFGAIPILIPIGAALVSIGAMTKWIKDAYTLNKKFDEIEKLIKRGISPERAVIMVDNLTKNPLFSLGSGLKIIPIVALLGGAFYLYKKSGK